MTLHRKVGIVIVVCLLGLGYRLWYHPDDFPKAVRALLDDRRLSLLLGADVRSYDACYEAQFRGGECGRWRLPVSHNPEYWPNPDAPPVKWPEQAKARAYQPGMDRVEYFNALCASEAGEFITKTVRAEGIYMVRPRQEETEATIRSRYELEDPYGYGQGDVGDQGPYSLVGAIEYTKFDTPHYAFVDSPAVPMRIHPTRRDTFHASVFRAAPEDQMFRRFAYPRERDRHQVRYLRDTVVSYHDRPGTRLAYTWRDIRRPYDREFDIAGGELVVIDLETNEILGIRRGFMLASRLAGGGISWLVGPSCPRYSQMPGLGRVRGRDKDGDFTALFLTKVVVPESRFVEGNR